MYCSFYVDSTVQDNSLDLAARTLWVEISPNQIVHRVAGEPVAHVFIMAIIMPPTPTPMLDLSPQMQHSRCIGRQRMRQEKNGGMCIMHISSAHGKDFSDLSLPMSR